MVRSTAPSSVRHRSLITLTCLLFATLAPVSAFWPATAVAGPYTASCEEVLSEDFEGETFDPENPEDVAEMETCEAESAEHAAHPEPSPEAPDFASFFGGLEAAVATGGVLLIACVVVLAVRRLTAF